MSIRGVDYSGARPAISTLKSNHIKFVCRYIGSHDYTRSRSAKWLSPSEYKSLKAAGLDVVVVFETTAHRADSGREAGVADAKTAVKELAYCALPSNTVVYFAVDFDATVGPKIAGYFQGAASVLGIHRVGVYGGYDVVKSCFDKGLVSWGWQTYAWSNGKWDPRAQIQQYKNGRQLDYDRAMKPNYGQVGTSATERLPAGQGKPSAGDKNHASRAQIVSYMKSLVGTYGPPNNANKFNDWYYGRHVSGDNYAWCVVFACYCWNHFGILKANGGKFAYVPQFKEHFTKVGSYREKPTSTKNLEPGDPVAYGSWEHFGTVYRVLGPTKFEAIEGNTTGKGKDDVAIKTRHISQVVGHAKLRGVDGTVDGTGKDEDFMADYVSIDKTDKSRKEALKSGHWQQIKFDRNNSHASSKHHPKGDYPSVLHGPCTYVGTVNVRVKNLPKGAEGQIRCVYVDKNNTTKAHCDIQEFSGSVIGDTFAKAAVSGFVPEGEKMRVEVVHYSNASTDPTVTAGSIRLHVRGTGHSTAHKGNKPSPHPPSGHGQVPIALSSVTFGKAKDASLSKDILPHVFKIMGIDDATAQEHWRSGIMTCASRESRYNLNAVNTTDSNAHGPLQSDHHPQYCSRGLMQVIPPTFAAHHQAGTSNDIYDGVANVCASMNYVMAKYKVARDGHDLAARVQQFDPNRKPMGY